MKTKKRERESTAIGDIILYAKVVLRSSRIVACCENDPACGSVINRLSLRFHDHRTEELALSDDTRDGRRGKNAILTHKDLPYAISRAHLQDDLEGLFVPIPSVASDYQRGSLLVSFGEPRKVKP